MRGNPLWGIFITMTRLERKESELNKLYEYRALAMRKNDLLWLHRNQSKIDELEKEIIEMRKNESATVFSVLQDKDEMIKHEVYKSLLRISLMADALNEAAEIARERLAEVGITSFNFQKKIEEVCRLSQEVASVTLRSKHKVMEDFITENDVFIEKCMANADEYLKAKMNL